MPVTTSTQPFDPEVIFAPAKRVERFMEKFLYERAMPDHLREAVRYSLLGPGKRLRPILTLRTCEAVGGKVETSLPAAAAIEMIHAFSLVHDDLPAMDDDDLRRGRPTLHKATSEAMAILAGDMLTGLAFEIVAVKMPTELSAAVSRELAQGTNDMIAGQVYDTLPDFDPKMAPMERLKTIHKHKTGALIRASCRMGAVCGLGNGSSVQGAKSLDAITRYAEAVGLMFQVVDDLLDVTQTTAHLGKAAGKDADKGKLTYPGLIGIDASRQEVQRLRGEAIDAIKGLGQPAQPLRDLCEFMAVRSK